MNIYFIAIAAIICFHMLQDHIIPDQLLIAAASISIDNIDSFLNNIISENDPESRGVKP